VPKGYVVSRVDVTDPDAYARYAAATTKVIAAHGGRALARGGRHEALEGKARARNVVLEFDSYEVARAISTPPSIRRRARYARARPRSKWCWWREYEMAKGYWIAHVEVTDPEAYKKYLAANAVAFAKYRGRFLVRGGTHVVAKGAAKSRQVILEFPDYAAALACLDSEEYKRAAEFRDAASLIDLIIAEGYDGPQPS
jgi:uncharacterized protein (DUF1330 family)